MKRKAEKRTLVSNRRSVCVSAYCTIYISYMYLEVSRDDKLNGKLFVFGFILLQRMRFSIVSSIYFGDTGLLSLHQAEDEHE